MMHELEVMLSRKHLETKGPFAGLWVRTAKALANGGYTSREQVRFDIENGKLHPYLTIRDYGKCADKEVRTWLGLKSWQENWGLNPIFVAQEDRDQAKKVRRS